MNTRPEEQGVSGCAGMAGLMADTGKDYRVWGVASLSDLFGNTIVFRKLVPEDPRLPSFAQLAPSLGLEKGHLPRKVDASYGAVVAELLRQTRALERPRGRLRRLVYIGDTRLSDKTAFLNVCAKGHFEGRAFIACEAMAEPPRVEKEGSISFANRWSALDGWLVELEEREGFALDEATAMVVDVDKTAIGARGRNDSPIDVARREALAAVASSVLKIPIPQGTLEEIHAELKQAFYHPLTSDNQDLLAYLCLVAGLDVYRLADLVRDFRRGRIASFQDVLGRVHERRAELKNLGLVEIHDRFQQRYLAGDPTPFKEFRCEEFRRTAARFGRHPSRDLLAELSERIFITEEVRRAAVRLRKRGGLVFGLSDKPEEASRPSPEDLRAGMKPLHQLETLSVGSPGP